VIMHDGSMPACCSTRRSQLFSASHNMHLTNSVISDSQECPRCKAALDPNSAHVGEQRRLSAPACYLYLQSPSWPHACIKRFPPRPAGFSNFGGDQRTM
jgi:hypothetical protein